MRQWEERRERAESSEEEISNADSNPVPSIDQEDVAVNADDDSSDDDVVDDIEKPFTLKEKDNKARTKTTKTLMWWHIFSDSSGILKLIEDFNRNILNQV